MKEYGYIKVGACVPEVKVGNTTFNTNEIIKQVNIAKKEKVDIILFPELSITGYTIGDLVFQNTLQNKALESLIKLKKESEGITIIVGLPLSIENKLYNVACIINDLKIVGIVPKTYIPNYNEFYEKRYFSCNYKGYITIDSEEVYVGSDIIFKNKYANFGIEICEDLWAPISVSEKLTDADIIFNLSASNEIIGKYEYRKNLIKMKSASLISGYVYASCGINESSSDLLFSGSSMIAENGSILKENERFDFNSNMIITDIDVNKIRNERLRNKTYSDKEDFEFKTINYNVLNNNQELTRNIRKTPFIPDNNIDSRCEEILSITSCALAKRFKHTGLKKAVIGISGGLDSTLAFLITLRAFEKLNIDTKNIICVTMPGFGTSKRTLNNSISLIEKNNATLRKIDIKKSCKVHLNDINHELDNYDIAYENAQARERTQILFDIANMEQALVIGTGDLSELALGWCTYNGDHMSNYSVNSSIPKTLIKYIINYIATKKDCNILKDIIETPISPELIKNQKTEDKIGKYEINDFFIYHFLRNNYDVKKINYLAHYAFKKDLTKELNEFMKRFFNNQFKRNCLPDSVKVGSISMSPRGDLRLPSDISYDDFIKEENI